MTEHITLRTTEDDRAALLALEAHLAKALQPLGRKPTLTDVVRFAIHRAHGTIKGVQG